MASGASGNALTLCILVMFISFAFGVPKCKFIAAKTKTVKIFNDLKNWNVARAHCQSTKVLIISIAVDNGKTIILHLLEYFSNLTS